MAALALSAAPWAPPRGPLGGAPGTLGARRAAVAAVSRARRWRAHRFKPSAQTPAWPQLCVHNARLPGPLTAPALLYLPAAGTLQRGPPLVVGCMGGRGAAARLQRARRRQQRQRAGNHHHLLLRRLRRAPRRDAAPAAGSGEATRAAQRQPRPAAAALGAGAVHRQVRAGVLRVCGGRDCTMQRSSGQAGSAPAALTPCVPLPPPHPP